MQRAEGNFHATVLRFAFRRAVAGDRIRRPHAGGANAIGRHALSDQRAGDAVCTLLRQTHIQILAAGAVGVADDVNSGFLVLFQHHGHAGQGVGAGRLQVGAIAVEGDVIRHVQHDIEVVKKLYRGAYDSHGAQFVAGGLPLGSELRWPVPETPTGHSMSEMMVLPALQSVLLPGGKQKIQSMRDFPLNQQNFDAVAQLAPLYNAANTNLHAYQQRGGKLILWHGLADDSVSPAFSIAYYRGVEAEMGHAATDTFLRLFLLPGVAHCGNGEGYDQIDLLTPLMRWTEEGIAPQEIMAGKRAPAATSLPPMTEKPDAQTQFHGVQKVSQPFADAAPAVIATRPAYPFPAIARYNGLGDVNDGENYHAEQSTAFGHLQLAKPASDYIGPDNQKNYQVRHGELTVQ